MRIPQQENSVEKRGWVAWFMRETNKTSRQEACTTYVGRRPPILLKERRHWGLHGRILEAQAKLVSLVGSALQMETQPEFERERETWVEQYFEKLIPILYFPESVFIHWNVIQKSYVLNQDFAFNRVNQATQPLFSTEFSYWAILILLLFISLIKYLNK